MPARRLDRCRPRQKLRALEVGGVCVHCLDRKRTLQYANASFFPRNNGNVRCPRSRRGRGGHRADSRCAAGLAVVRRAASFALSRGREGWASALRIRCKLHERSCPQRGPVVRELAALSWRSPKVPEDARKSAGLRRNAHAGSAGLASACPFLRPVRLPI